MSPNVTDLDCDLLVSFNKASEVVVVGYTAQNDDSSTQILEAVAEALHNEYLFGTVHDEVLARQEQVEMPGVVVYKDFDEGKKVLDGIASIDSVTNFVRNSAVPLVIEFLPETPRNVQNVSLVVGIHRYWALFTQMHTRGDRILTNTSYRRSLIHNEC